MKHHMRGTCRPKRFGIYCIVPVYDIHGDVFSVGVRAFCRVQVDHRFEVVTVSEFVGEVACLGQQKLPL